CASPAGSRTTRSTRSTAGSRRHSRSTPRPTIPVPPKSATFIAGTCSPCVDGIGRSAAGSKKRAYTSRASSFSNSLKDVGGAPPKEVDAGEARRIVSLSLLVTRVCRYRDRRDPPTRRGQRRELLPLLQAKGGSAAGGPAALRPVARPRHRRARARAPRRSDR